MKWLWRIGAALAFMGAAFLIASYTTRHTMTYQLPIQPPQHAKSQPEIYGFGYRPALVYSEDRKSCRDRNPLKNAYYGDLHVHTALSADAYPDGTRIFPKEAYAFAKGAPIDLPPRYGVIGEPVQLRRPLDFAAITEHIESVGEGYICRTKGAFSGYDSPECDTFRKGEEAGLRIFTTVHAFMNPRRKARVCGPDNTDCTEATKIVWQGLIDEAEAAYDRTETCAFSSFVGYEYTRSPSGMHMHRNTIFRNTDVPDRPGNYIDDPTLPDLLTKLERDCRAGIEACDAISIPHNSNLSGGNAFNVYSLNGLSEADQQAHRQQRASYDRLAELTQHKGHSECVNGLTDILSDADEYCDMEAIRRPGGRVRAFETTTWIPRLFRKTLEECTKADIDPKDNLYKGPCIGAHDFLRGAWLAGLKDAVDYGINPFQMGVIGSTDTHMGLAGHTHEGDYRGHVAHETTLSERLGEPGLGRHNRIEANPGGLAGVWAVENSRDALFQSMKRREAFATSGTRIAPRFFAGVYEDDLCEASDWLKTAYAQGVPMGADFPTEVIASQADISLLVQASKDPAPDAQGLKEIQIIKGWVDAKGQKRSSILSVSHADTSEGATDLCAQYRDPDYNPALPTYYYMRVIETPKLRWNVAQCQALAPDQRPDQCALQKEDYVVDMAWSSPIWFMPARGAALLSIP